MARVTLRTIAERVGVSVMTVSNAFSRPDQLSHELRGRILAVADDLGYAGPNPVARSLSLGQSGNVGILRTETAHYAFTDEHSTILLAALADELGRAGLALTLLPSIGPGPAVPARDVAMDGAIVHSCPPASDSLAHLRKRQLPIVALDQAPEDGTTAVNIDDRGGAVAAASHLIELGHRRIAVVGLTGAFEERGFHPARERMAGWTEALAAAGVEPLVVQVANSTQERGAEAVRKILAGPERVTGVLAVSDAVAAGVVRGAEDEGVRVPRDLSVVGFDDVPLASRIRPALTTVRQDVDAKGRAVVRLLVEHLREHRGGHEPEPRLVLLDTELVVRDSTAPPAPGGRAQ